MKTYDLLMILTEKCNLLCPHCYMVDKTRSLSRESRDLFVSNLAPNPARISLEGGEIYCEKDLLYSTIKLLRNKFGKDFTLRLETNGVAFYKNRDSILEEADRLVKLGVDKIRVSLDDFHVQGGADRKKLISIAKVLEEESHQLKVSYLSLNNAVAVGNAENLPKELKQVRKCMNKPSSQEHPFFFTDILGEVYLCPWRITPSLGNLSKQNLSEMFTQRDYIQSNILTGNIPKLSDETEIVEIRDKQGDCMVCKQLFKNGKNI